MRYNLYVHNSIFDRCGDGTFDVTRKPLKQLYSLHAFVRQGDADKQVIIDS